MNVIRFYCTVNWGSMGQKGNSKQAKFHGGIRTLWTLEHINIGK